VGKEALFRLQMGDTVHAAFHHFIRVSLFPQGRYRYGLPYGICWRSNDGEGWYVGGCNRVNRMTGDGVVYLYPDLRTALVGRWSNDCMRAAKLALVVGLETREGMPHPVTEKVASDTTTYVGDVSGYDVISRNPMLPDPYESARVAVTESSLPGGGEGLFAKRDLPSDVVVAFYNGIRFHDCHVRLGDQRPLHSFIRRFPFSAGL